MNYPENASQRPPNQPNNACNSAGETDQHQTNKKRKRESLDLSRVSDWFSAKIISSDNSKPESTLSLSPVTTVLRAHIPLSWLSDESSSAKVRHGSVLQADIASLTRWEYSVLIARHVPNGALYAIERLEGNAYISFPLREFVTTEIAKQASVGAAPCVSLDRILQPDLRLNYHQHQHQRSASISSTTSARAQRDRANSPEQLRNRRGMLARQVILGKQAQPVEGPDLSWGIVDDTTKVSEDTSCDSNINDAAQQQIGHRNSSHSFPVTHNSQTEGDLAVKDPGVPEISNTIEATEDKQLHIDQLSPEYLRKRYLEMLYLSKTSLAFYAKGPLNRTRARARAPGASMTLQVLAAFYEDSLLPVKKLDLKYKTALLDKVKSLVTLQDNPEDGYSQQDVHTTIPESKKTRRTKLGKDALWPMEDEFIQKWWHIQEFTCGSVNTSEAFEAEIQRKLPSLRMREMELQVILILEILALESSESKAAGGILNESRIVQTDSANDAAPTVDSKTSKVRKRRNLKADLEILLDRICILQSVGFEGMLDGPKHQIMTKDASGDNTKDNLKDFCKDVVIPFYSSKLPDECKTVCRKLGGLDLSPKRPKVTPANPPSHPSPGSAIPPRRSAPGRRNLNGVLKEEHGLRNGSPSVLMRSSTLPAVGNPKREPSERPKSRGGVQKSLSFSNREIDLVADAQATEAKRRKLDRIVSQKRELEAAIDALKKPNRLIAAKTFMDDVESRSTDSWLPSKRNDPIQILATPKVSRIKPILVEEYDLPPIASVTSKSEDAFVPSSTIKPRGLSQIASTARPSARRKAVLAAIHNTPMRQRGHHSGKMDAETVRDTDGNPGSRNESSCTLINSTPSTPRLRPDIFDRICSTPTQLGRQDESFFPTPTKRTPMRMEAAFRDIPEIANKMMDRVMKVSDADAEPSIYESLGWTNDEYDI